MPTLTRRPCAFRLPPVVVQDIGAYVQAHLGEPLRLATLARVAHLSPEHFAHCWRITTGEPPMQMVRRVRMARAAYLLSYTPLALPEIAFAVGCSEQSQFGALFKKSFGRTPWQYRVQTRPPAPVDALQAVIVAWGELSREVQDALAQLVQFITGRKT